MTVSISFPSTPFRLGLYPVVDSLDWIEKLLAVGVRTIQLRVKNLSSQTTSELVREAAQIGKRHQARLFINDYWQLAIEHGAYGVHLGQEDLNSASLAAIAKAGLRLGVSSQGEAELKRAVAIRPSYIAMGHIFATNSKVMETEPLGLSALKQLVDSVPDYPVVAIGGIQSQQVADVLACGVGSIAMISAITQAADWKATTLALLNQIPQD